MRNILESQLEFQDYSVSLFEKASHVISGDDFLAIPLRNCLRVAVFDGVTETSSTIKHFSESGDSFAAGLARTAFKADRDLASIAQEINTYLNSFSGERTRDLPQATAVVADIHPEHVKVIRAGDCEAWVKQDGLFSPVFKKPMLKEAPLQQFLLWRKENPDADAETSFSAEEKCFGDRSHWNASALGRFSEAKLQTEVIKGGWEEIILASDGAHLNQDVVSNIDFWKEWVVKQTLVTKYKKVDDLTLLRCLPRR